MGLEPSSPNSLQTTWFESPIYKETNLNTGVNLDETGLQIRTHSKLLGKIVRSKLIPSRVDSHDQCQHLPIHTKIMIILFNETLDSNLVNRSPHGLSKYHQADQHWHGRGTWRQLVCNIRFIGIIKAKAFKEINVGLHEREEAEDSKHDTLRSQIVIKQILRRVTDIQLYLSDDKILNCMP